MQKVGYADMAFYRQSALIILNSPIMVHEIWHLPGLAFGKGGYIYNFKKRFSKVGKIVPSIIDW
jgi:hypothetical protein